MSVNEPEMDDWAALWAEPEQQGQGEDLTRLARRASRRGRLIESASLFFSFLIAAAVIVALAIRPTPVSIAMGIVATAGLLWSTLHWYRLHRVLLQLAGTEDRVELIERRLGQVRVELHRSTLGLIATPPIILLFALLTFSIQREGSVAGFFNMVWDGLRDVPTGPAILAALVTIVVQQSQSTKRLRRELESLRVLGKAYREEARLDRLALG